MIPVLRAGIGLVSLVALLLFVELLSGVAQTEYLPFETISHGCSPGSGGEKPSPKIFIISEKSDLASVQLGMFFPSRLTAELTSLDYERYFAVLVLQPDVGIDAGLIIQGIRKQGYRVTVEATLDFPAPGRITHPVGGTACRLVAVSKEGAWNESIQFVLVLDGKTIVDVPHFIP